MSSNKPEPAVLSSHIEMGTVMLEVSDITSLTNFYSEIIGLDILKKNDTEVALGSADIPVLILKKSQLPEPAPLSAGLYHLAILFESRATLARSLKRVLTTHKSLFSGSADHLVSEAFYLTDPEGNGVELYYDRNPTTWQWIQGTVVMKSEYIDPIEYIKTHDDQSADQRMKLGHIHLKVGNIIHAINFYVDIVGLSITAQMPSALFLSDGTYHHHLGMNTWESFGVGKRQPSLGLHSYELVIPGEMALSNLKNRLTAHTITFTEDNSTLTFSDPWGNVCTVKV